MRPASNNNCGFSGPECYRAHAFSFMETASPGRWIYIAKSDSGFGQSGRGTQVGTLGGSWSAQVDHFGSGGISGCCGHSTAATMLDRDGNVYFLRSASGGENTYYRKSTDGGFTWGPFVNAYDPDLAGLTTSAPVGLFVPGYSLGEYVWYAGFGGAESAARVIPLWSTPKPYAETGTIRLFGSAGGDLPETNVAPSVSLPASASATAGVALALAGSFTDPDTAQTWTASVDFGDGTGDSVALAADKTFTVRHTFSDAGSFSLVRDGHRQRRRDGERDDGSDRGERGAD
jgi:hypothetical protein